MASKALNRKTAKATVNYKPPTVRVKAPDVVVPEIKIPPIQVPPVNFGPISNELTKLNEAVRALQNVVAFQNATIEKLESRLADIKVTVPPRPRTFEVDIDDGNGGTRRMRVRASK
jgi:hypothetical protein